MNETNEHTHDLKINLFTIIIAAMLGLFLTITELAANKNGLELRTFAQVIKGIYLWLIMPCLILFSGSALLKGLQEKDLQEQEDAQIKLNSVLNRLHRIVVVIFLLIIVFVSFMRGLFYVFTEELITEEITQDGYIRGTYAGFLSETQYRYYVPTAIFFRKPFPGWTPEQLSAKIKEDYSPEAELVEKQPDGWYVFRVPDALAAESYIYFHVSDSYMRTNNYPLQVLLSEAAYFWDERERYVTFSDNHIPLKEAMDTGAAIDAPFSAYDTLYITCYDSPKDIAACAADIIDWLHFVKNTGQFPYDSAYAAHLLKNIQIGSDSSYFSIDISPLSDYIDDDSWEIKYQRMKTAITEAFEKHREWLNRQYQQNISQPDTPIDIDAADALFMQSYDAQYYEKECLIGDGLVRYRMVVRDAALGNRMYSLLKSTDGGETWQISSSTPFGETMGMGIDFTFLNENFGFATLMHNGGDEADLYVTEDGGDTYQLVIMEAYTVTLDNGYTYNPYDYPQMPYEEAGTIYVLCGQGADGDYAGGDAAGLALYQSTDGGHTFCFVKIQPPVPEE